MDKLYRRIITTKELRGLLPYLTEYFGITHEHFSFEIATGIIKARKIQEQITALNKEIHIKEEEKLSLENQLKDNAIQNDLKIRNKQKVFILNSEIKNKKTDIENIITNTAKWMFAIPITGSVKYTDFLACNELELELYHEFSNDRFFKLFNRKRKATESDIEIDSLTADILFAVAIIVKRRKIFEQAGIYHYSNTTPYKDVDEFEQKNKHKDLLELYQFVNQIKSKKYHPITINHPKNSITLSNYNHWLESFFEEHLKVALPDIQNIEQAQEELKAYTPKKGRKAINRNRDVVMYGIYRLFKEHLKIETKMPNDLSDFIIAYLDFVGLGIDRGKRYPQYISTQIDNIKKNPARHKFEYLI